MKHIQIPASLDVVGATANATRYVSHVPYTEPMSVLLDG